MLANTRGPSMNPACAATINTRTFRDDRHQHEDRRQHRGQPQLADERLAQHLVHRLVFGGMHVEQQVTDHQPTRRDRQRDGHVQHRPLAGRHAQLAQITGMLFETASIPVYVPAPNE